MNKRILITLTPAELIELDKYSAWMGVPRSRLISNALLHLFSDFEQIYPHKTDPKKAVNKKQA